jgi:hypothetical protein
MKIVRSFKARLSKPVTHAVVWLVQTLMWRRMLEVHRLRPPKPPLSEVLRKKMLTVKSLPQEQRSSLPASAQVHRCVTQRATA